MLSLFFRQGEAPVSKQIAAPDAQTGE
ncbi:MULTISPECIES: hypothetical protein [Sphingomonadaceae]|nr:hypothetical protein [Sphingobium yanoikuyae]WQE09559.1 hypothetical protein U0025_08400 [Sphingobium yanoikuyae]